MRGRTFRKAPRAARKTTLNSARRPTARPARSGASLRPRPRTIIRRAEAIEAAAINFAGRNLMEGRPRAGLRAPAARIARGRFRPGAAAARARGRAEGRRRGARRSRSGARIWRTTRARGALARACAGCLRNLYVEEKLDDEAPAARGLPGPRRFLHARAPADAARLSARAATASATSPRPASRASRIPVEARPGIRSVQRGRPSTHVAAAAARAGPELKKLLPRLARLAASNAKARAAATPGAEPHIDRRWLRGAAAPTCDEIPRRPLRVIMCSKGPAGLARRRRFSLTSLAAEITCCCQTGRFLKKPGPERALKASLTSTAPPCNS